MPIFGTPFEGPKEGETEEIRNFSGFDRSKSERLLVIPTWAYRLQRLKGQADKRLERVGLRPNCQQRLRLGRV